MANLAHSDSEHALTIANDAKTTAEGIESIATGAQGTADSAVSMATEATETATAAMTAANNIQTILNNRVVVSVTLPNIRIVGNHQPVSVPVLLLPTDNERGMIIITLGESETYGDTFISAMTGVSNDVALDIASAITMPTGKTKISAHTAITLLEGDIGGRLFVYTPESGIPTLKIITNTSSSGSGAVAIRKQILIGSYRFT